MKQHTELIDYFVNPTFLEQIKQPKASINYNLYFSFDFERGGRKYSITMHMGKEGQVNINTITKNGLIGRTVLTDYCQNIEDLKRMFEKLDEMATRIPEMD